jgi:hypothetical protein
MSKFRKTSGGGIIFQCPGCKGYHSLTIRVPGQQEVHPSWIFNGDFEKPTLQPSILSRRWRSGENNPPDVCHSFVTDGRIRFLPDCTHELKGQTVDVPEWPHAPRSFGGIEE